MFNATFRSIFNIASVTEDASGITITGFDQDKLSSDIQKTWGTTRVFSNIFTSTRKGVVTFNRFFAVDILYMLDAIRQGGRRIRSNSYRVGKVIDLLEENTWLSTLNRKNPDILDFSQLKHLHHKPFEHQTEFLHVYNEKVPKMRLKGFLLAADVGTGKTYMSLALATCLKSDVVIIVAPKSTISTVWVDSIREEFGDNVPMWASIYNEPLRAGCKYYVFHYEALSRAVDFAKELKCNKPFIALDESHNFNDIGAQRVQSFIELCKTLNCKHTVFCSGTAVKALGYETIPLLRCIDDYFNLDAELRFKAIYGVSAKRATDILRNRMGLVAHKIPKTVVMKIAPPITTQIRVKLPNGDRYTVSNIRNEMKLFMAARLEYYRKNMAHYSGVYTDCLKLYEHTIRTSDERKEFVKYKQFVDTIVKYYDPMQHKEEARFCNWFEEKRIRPLLSPDMKKSFTAAKSTVKYVGLKVMGEALANILGKARAQCHVDMIEYSGTDGIVKNADKKTICFSNFVEVIKAAGEYFTRAGFEPILVYGDTNKDVPEIVKKFKTEPSVNPLLATIQSLSTGQTLIEANVCILYNMPFRHFEREQAVHRIHRIGQDTQAWVYEITLDTGDEPNISTRAEDIMLWSKQQVAAILGVDNVSDDKLTVVTEHLINHGAEMDNLLLAKLDDLSEPITTTITSDDLTIEFLASQLEDRQTKRELAELRTRKINLEDSVERLTAIRDTVVKYGINQPMMEACDPRGELITAGVCGSYENLSATSATDDQSQAVVERLNVKIGELNQAITASQEGIIDKIKSMIASYKQWKSDRKKVSAYRSSGAEALAHFNTIKSFDEARFAKIHVNSVPTTEAVDVLPKLAAKIGPAVRNNYMSGELSKLMTAIEKHDLNVGKVTAAVEKNLKYFVDDFWKEPDQKKIAHEYTPGEAGYTVSNLRSYVEKMMKLWADWDGESDDKFADLLDRYYDDLLNEGPFGTSRNDSPDVKLAKKYLDKSIIAVYDIVDNEHGFLGIITGLTFDADKLLLAAIKCGKE